jgi:hypothetical protein
MLYVDIALATQDADAKGVPRAERDEDSPLFKLLIDFRNDNAILALVNAGMDADVPAMRAAFPAGTKACELHIAGLDRWKASIGLGVVLSNKMIKLADIVMIASSLYQVWKMPVVPAGGSPKPPTIVGTLPGGAAVGSVVSLPSLARALEAIRRLVALGALDGAVIAGIGSLGAARASPCRSCSGRPACRCSRDREVEAQARRRHLPQGDQRPTMLALKAMFRLCHQVRTRTSTRSTRQRR